MLGPINSIRTLTSISTVPAAFDSVQQTTRKAFEQMKNSAIQSISSLKKGIESIDWHPLGDPGNLVEGGIWAGFWGLCALFSGISLYELYQELTIEHPASEKFAKISKAAKTAFVDLISLGGATAYNIHWAHEVKMISLGQYAPLIKSLGYGSSLIINIVEGGWSIYNIAIEKEAILKETLPEQQEKHKQRLCLSLMKLIGNISMIVWTALGVAAIVTSLTVSPMLMSILLIIGCVLPVAVFFYQRHLENAPELCPLPQFNFRSSAA
jgi:hypothetical protein